MVNEYLNDCEVIEEGEHKWVSPMEWLETVYVQGTKLEAFTTSGGLGTMCETFLGRAENLDYKTMRYPGHVALMNFFFHELLMRDHRDIERLGVIPDPHRLAVEVAAEARNAPPDIGVVLRIRHDDYGKRLLHGLLAGASNEADNAERETQSQPPNRLLSHYYCPLSLIEPSDRNHASRSDWRTRMSAPPQPHGIATVPTNTYFHG